MTLFNPMMPLNTGKMIYASDSYAVVGQNSNARMSMLPTAISGFNGLVKAGTMTTGSCLRLDGYGLIRARSLTPGTFVFTPTVTPVGGSKVDLHGLTVSPLIGMAAICELSLFFLQTATGIQTGGVVKYGVQNGTPYSLMINQPAVGQKPGIVASDPSVDRIFGADGQWMIADPDNYVIPSFVIATLFS
ncbi:MAG: hypothetical protein EOO77_16590 [Oxalobacteraceae bacterium]|nr:MAG: hypothetical protein EOO77_16590 [Oxalobacteraceae bacterium]